MSISEMEKMSVLYNKTTLYDFPTIHENETFLYLMDEVNIEVSRLLARKNYTTIFKIFIHYLDTEMYIKIFIQEGSKKRLSIRLFKRYQKLEELSNYYKSFRILLVSQLAEYLLFQYNYMLNLTNSDLLKSTKIYTSLKKMLEFYISNFKAYFIMKYKNPTGINFEEIKQYQDVLKTLEEIKSLLNSIPKSKKTIFSLLSI